MLQIALQYVIEQRRRRTARQHAGRNERPREQIGIGFAVLAHGTRGARGEMLDRARRIEGRVTIDDEAG